MGYILVEHIPESVEYNRKRFMMDEDIASDLPPITSDIAIGSEAIVITTGKTYVLDTSRQWVVSSVSGSSGGGGGGGGEEGGVSETWVRSNFEPIIDPKNDAFNKLAGQGLKVDGQVLSVDMADDAVQDNTKPISSAAVYREIGNIDALLKTI